jgi:hypothetical protein
MRDFLESLAVIFVWLGGIASVVGLFILLFAIFSIAQVSVALGVDVTLAGVGVMLAAGSVYLLALIAEAVQRRTPQAGQPAIPDELGVGIGERMPRKFRD